MSHDSHMTHAPIIGLPSVKKYFYFEDPAVAAMTQADVEEFRQCVCQWFSQCCEVSWWCQHQHSVVFYNHIPQLNKRDQQLNDIPMLVYFDPPCLVSEGLLAMVSLWVTFLVRIVQSHIQSPPSSKRSIIIVSAPHSSVCACTSILCVIAAEILREIRKAKFEKPSPIQVECVLGHMYCCNIQ